MTFFLLRGSRPSCAFVEWTAAEDGFVYRRNRLQRFLMFFVGRRVGPGLISSSSCPYLPAVYLE